MTTFLTVLIVIFAIAALVSLIRGVVAFLQSSRQELLGEEGDGATEMQLKQNKMMFSRIKFQALAVLAIAVLLMMSR